LTEENKETPAVPENTEKPAASAAQPAEGGQPAEKKPRVKKARVKKPKGGKIILVESPTKVHTIQKYVKGKYVVMATKGHVKDLPKSKLGIDIEHNFEPYYIVLKDKRKILSEIKKAVKQVDEVYLATDPDREGEAICWHVAEEIKKLGGKKMYRVTFNEITKTAVLKALDEPREINMNLVNAQQARRVLDRLVGYKISPLLWKAIRKGLSAGRVQSVALKLIVERQAEIDAFNPVEYWSIRAILDSGGKQLIDAKLTEKNGEKIDLKNAADSGAIVEELKNAEYVITEVTKKERRRKALPPFITSTLQQDSARKYHFTAQKTMMIAQQLYEGVTIAGEGQVGLITYMRTDSLRIADEAQKEAAAYIESSLGKEYLPETPNVYKSRKSAQDAHEAIRPSSVVRHPNDIKDNLDNDQFKVYSLIWKRFVASQMAPSIFDDTRVKIGAGAYTFQANGSIQRFDGFLKVYEVIADADKPVDNSGNLDEDKSEDRRLPDVTQGDRLGLKELLPEQHFTQPPPAFSDATLVKALEEKDIGRPSTYAPIISVLVARKYIIRERGKFTPTELGTLVAKILLQQFSTIINEEFTAKMEADLDKVEEGTIEWHDLMRTFWTTFEVLLKAAEPYMLDMKKDIEGDTGEICEKCGGKMIIKWGRHGKFMSCERYPECKNAKPIGEDGKKKEEVQLNENCPTCGAPLVIKHGPYGEFIACSKYPECRYTKQIVKKVGVKCPDCGGDIIERTFKRFRKFYGCSNYPACKFMVWDKPIPEKCPQCGADFVLEKWKKTGSVIYCKKCDYKVDKVEPKDDNQAVDAPVAQPPEQAQENKPVQDNAQAQASPAAQEDTPEKKNE
jgi:DNA topoisomerase-1